MMTACRTLKALNKHCGDDGGLETEEEAVEKDIPEWVDGSGDDLGENEVDGAWIEV
jgi:hypothetical protein